VEEEQRPLIPHKPKEECGRQRGVEPRLKDHSATGMPRNGADSMLWAEIRRTAGCEESAAEDAAVLEELEGAAQVRMAEELGEYAGPGRGPGWISEADSELERLSSFAVDPGEPGEGILWEAFRELEQQRFRVFVNGCAREWMAQAEAQDSERAAQNWEEEDRSGSLAGESQECDVQGSGDEESLEDRVFVMVENLAANMTAEILQGTFKQVGSVLGAEMGGEGWGWVEFEVREEAEDAVQRFGDVVLAGEPMMCYLHSG
jgi:hypothetical protein